MNVKVVSESNLVREVVANLFSENFELTTLESLDTLNNVREDLSIKSDFLCILVEKSQLDELKLIDNIKSQNPKVKIMLMDIGSGRNLLPEVIKYDVDGYISSNFKKEELISVIKILLGGKKYYDGNSIVDTFGKYNYYKSYNLTDREKEILTCIVEGLDNKDIANSLYISENTVKKHVSSVLAKLNFKNRKQAIVQLREYGII